MEAMVPCCTVDAPLITEYHSTYPISTAFTIIPSLGKACWNLAHVRSSQSSYQRDTSGAFLGLCQGRMECRVFRARTQVLTVGWMQVPTAGFALGKDADLRLEWGFASFPC